jgi:AcrR family transcriptional regulator
MTSRRYCLGQRQIAADATRAGIIVAARKLLTGRRGGEKFTMDAVAAAAGVAKMTLYHQFGSKRELLEALFDDLGARNLACHFGEVFETADAMESLSRFIELFARFWTAERLVIRRINAQAAVDPVFAESLAGRDERRRQGLTHILGRVAEEAGTPTNRDLDEAIRVVFTLTSFQTFDSLAGADRTPEEVAATIHNLVLAAIGVAPTAKKRATRK